MKIYTKTGDQGSTSLFGGKRVSKANLRIEAYGNVDELNAFIGLLADEPANENHSALLREIQERLFTIGATLAADPEKPSLIKPDLTEEDIQKIERAIDAQQENLTPLKNFILPGGHTTVSYAHLARVVCRRTERSVVALNEVEPIDALVMHYLNRLSDYFFVLGRTLAKELNVEEIPWIPRETKS